MSHYNMASESHNSILTSNSLIHYEYQYKAVICVKYKSAFPIMHIFPITFEFTIIILLAYID